MEAINISERKIGSTDSIKATAPNTSRSASCGAIQIWDESLIAVMHSVNLM
jgi:hypothetical protein